MGGGKEGEYRKKAWEKGERRRSTLRKYATEMGRGGSWEKKTSVWRERGVLGC